LIVQNTRFHLTRLSPIRWRNMDEERTKSGEHGLNDILWYPLTDLDLAMDEHG